MIGVQAWLAYERAKRDGDRCLFAIQERLKGARRHPCGPYNRHLPLHVARSYGALYGGWSGAFEAVVGVLGARIKHRLRVR